MQHHRRRRRCREGPLLAQLSAPWGLLRRHSASGTEGTFVTERQPQDGSSSSTGGGAGKEAAEAEGSERLGRVVAQAFGK